jgi:hypothetical protein
MSSIPLHIKRKFEQRWSAKLASLVPSAARKSISLERIVKKARRARLKITEDGRRKGALHPPSVASRI